MWGPGMVSGICCQAQGGDWLRTSKPHQVTGSEGLRLCELPLCLGAVNSEQERGSKGAGLHNRKMTLMLTQSGLQN